MKAEMEKCRDIEKEYLIERILSMELYMFLIRLCTIVFEERKY